MCSRSWRQNRGSANSFLSRRSRRSSNQVSSEETSKLKVRVGSFLVLFCLAMSGIAAHAIDVLYNNGGGSEFLQMWDISGNAAASNQFTCNFSTCNTSILEFDATPTWGTDATKATWSITSAPLGGTTFASGTTSLPQIYPCDPDGVVCLFDINFASTLSGGTYYLNLTGVDAPLAWDTTSHPVNGNNAYYMDANGVLTSNIQGEGFKIEGSSTPEPGSIMLFGSGVVGFAGLLRRRFLS
jgi:hypothetical protein